MTMIHRLYANSKRLGKGDFLKLVFHGREDQVFTYEQLLSSSQRWLSGDGAER